MLLPLAWENLQITARFMGAGNHSHAADIGHRHPRRPELERRVALRVLDGVVKKGMRIKLMQTGADYNVDTLGVLRPRREDVAELGPGEIGILTGSIKEVADARVGDTITEMRRETARALPGFKPAQPPRGT